MATLKFDGANKYIRQLKKLEANTDRTIGRALYAGAAVITDAIRANIEALPSVPDRIGVIAHQCGELTPLTDTAKRGLLDGLGIASMTMENGIYDVKVGFDGYNALRTRQYPKGQPNQLIARVTENGSSYARRQPFIKPAMRAKRAAAEQAMSRVVDKEIEKMMK